MSGRIFRSGAALPILFMIAGGVASMSMGTDANWDLRNYHLFGAYAFLHGLTFHHLAAAQFQSFFNPLLQLPVYGLFTLLAEWPRVYAFCMGVPAGICAYLLLRIALLHASAAGLSALVGRVATGLAMVVGLSGAAFVPAIGTSSADILVAVPLLASYLLVLRGAAAHDRGQRPDPGHIALAGALAGLAAGLKLTMAIYAAPLGLMILVLLGPRAALWAAVAMAAGFAAGWGPFAWILWRETGNPFFPMFNQVFRSPDYLPVAVADERFLPRSVWQAMTYPFWWVVKTQGLVSELPLRDPRVALGTVGAVALLASAVRARLRRTDWLLLGVTALSLALWCRLFGIYRYLIVLEMLSPLLVMLALVRWSPRAVPIGLAAVAALCLATTIRPDWGHIRTGQRLLAVEAMPVRAGALVLLAGDAAQAYLVPFMPDRVRAVGIGNNIIRADQEHGLRARIREIVAAHRGVTWFVTESGMDEARSDAIRSGFGIAALGECELVRTNHNPAGHQFCRVRGPD